MHATNKECSKAVRAELKKEFPNVKFRVRTDVYRIEVDYVDGPAYDTVRKIMDKYEMGHFNSMEDIYEYDNSREDVPQREYAFVEREISLEYGQDALDEFNKYWNTDCKPNVRDSYMYEIPVISSIQDIDWNRQWIEFINKYNFSNK